MNYQNCRVQCINEKKYGSSIMMVKMIEIERWGARGGVRLKTNDPYHEREEGRKFFFVHSIPSSFDISCKYSSTSPSTTSSSVFSWILNDDLEYSERGRL